MIKYLPGLAVISAAILWSLDGYIRQNLSTLPSFFIISLEHIIGAIIFFPILIKGWGEIVKIQQRGWISVLWISICGGILGTFFYTKALSYVGYINLSVVVLLQKFQPIFAISLASIILKEHITKRFLILALSAIVGGYFITHPRYRQYQVSVKDAEHPIMKGVDEEFMVEDEQYLLDYDPRVHVLANALWQGDTMPVAWTKDHGEGRVFYQALGHDPKACEHPAFKQMLIQGTLWAAGAA